MVGSGGVPAAAVGEVEALISQIEAGAAVVEPLAAQPAGTAWDAAVRAYAGQGWEEVPWFFIETYAYRRVLDILHAVSPGADPFQRQKDAAVAAAIPAFRDTVLPLWRPGGEGTMRTMLMRSLWGNRADLSFSGGKLHAGPGEDADHDALLLADDSATAAAALEAICAGTAVSSGTTASVGIVLDNCGLELLSDLAWVSFMLRASGGKAGGSASPHPLRIVLFCKADPIFVSDAQAKDVHAHIAALEGMGGGDPTALAADLRSHLAAGRLVLVEDRFLNGPQPWWDMPSHLAAQFAELSMLITKGDANYRRLLGDLHWPHDTPFPHVVQYLARLCPVLALRTCKAGVLVGVTPEQEAGAVARHPTDWLVSGLYGVVQLAPLRTDP